MIRNNIDNDIKIRDKLLNRIYYFFFKKTDTKKSIYYLNDIESVDTIDTQNKTI